MHGASDGKRLVLFNRIVLYALSLVTLQPYSKAVPQYNIGVLTPTTEELTAMDPSGLSPQTYISNFYSTLREAKRDVNARFGKEFTLELTWHIASAEHNTSSVSVLKWLSDSPSSAPIAVIGPFHVGHVKSLLPLAQLAHVPLVSPAISRSQMSSFLSSDSSFAVSMEPRQQTRGGEVFGILEYHNWKDIALITSGPSEYVDEENVAAILSLSPLYNVNVLQRVRLPLWFQHENNTKVFEEKIYEGLMKIVDSGVTVIVLSIEAVKETYTVLFRIANDVGLLNKFNAWIALRFPSPPNDQLAWFNVNNVAVAKFMNGMLIIHPDLTTDEDRAVDSVTLRVPDRAKIIKSRRLYQFSYDAIWTIAHGINKMHENKLYPNVTIFDRLSDTELIRWITGKQLIQFISRLDFKGLSGRVEFDRGLASRAGERITRFKVFNIQKAEDYGYQLNEVGSCKIENNEIKIRSSIRYYNDSIRSPTGDVDICRHALNVLIPGGQYYRYLQFANSTEGTVYLGWVVDLFKEAASSQCLTKWNFFSKPNMTWDEAITQVGRDINDMESMDNQSSHKYHVAIGPFGVTAERAAKADFTRSIKTTGYRVAILRPAAKKPTLWQFIQPFSWQLWLTSAAFIFFGGIVIFTLERKRKAVPNNAPGLEDSMFVSMSSIFYTQDQDSVLSHSGRGFVAILCFVALILGACFTANLTVFLLKRHPDTTYQTIQGLRNRVVGAPNVTGALEHLKRAYAHLNIIFVDVSPASGLSYLISRKIEAFVDDASALELLERTHCEIQLMKDTIFTVNAAFALEPRSYYKEKLNQGIVNAWGTNFIEHLDQIYFEWADECHNYHEVAADESLNLQHLGGLFIIFAGTAALCLLGDLIRRSLHKYGILRYNLDNEPAGVHAAARGIKAMVETVADVSLAGSLAGSTWSLSGHGLQRNEESSRRHYKKRSGLGLGSNKLQASSTWSLPADTMAIQKETSRGASHKGKSPLLTTDFLVSTKKKDRRAPLPALETHFQG